MASRPSWKGQLKVSLVSCPVALYSATTEAKMVSFHLIHPKTHNRIQMKPFDPELGEVERQELVHGYEIDKGTYVTVDDDDLEKIRLPSTKVIEIEKFVGATEIDPLYLDRPYFLVPDGAAGNEAYAVIREAMQREKKIGLGRLVISHRERTIALRPESKGIVVNMLRNPDEVRREADYFEGIPAGKSDPDMLAIAAKIIEQHSGKFTPKDFEDHYERALRDLIKAKSRGKKLVALEPPAEESKVVDLMSALKASLRPAGRKAPAGGADIVPLRPAKRKAPPKAKRAKPRKRAKG